MVCRDVQKEELAIFYMCLGIQVMNMMLKARPGGSKGWNLKILPGRTAEVEEARAGIVSFLFAS